MPEFHFTSEARRAWNAVSLVIGQELNMLNLDEKNKFELFEASRVAFERCVRSGKAFGEATETARYAASLE